MWKACIVAFIIGLLIVIQLYRMTKGFRQYTKRTSQEAVWKQFYPIESHQAVIAEMLESLCRSFMFSPTKKWCFHPDDTFAAILDATDNNHTDHLQYDMFFVCLQDLGLKERPRFEEESIRTVAELLIAARFNTNVS